MRISNYATTALFTIGLLISSAESRSKRIDQIPNGTVNRCTNCHIDPGGGGERTAFGEVVRLNYLDAAGDVMWNLALAQNDADGDGATNGQELLDPDGTWAIGMANPGEATLVSNPGDANSITKVELVAGSSTPRFYSLDQNYPNPFNPATTIYFDVAQAGEVQLRIFNSLGQIVRTQENESYEPGRYQVQWDGLDDFGQSLSSGLYLYRLDTHNFSKTRRMTLLK